MDIPPAILAFLFFSITCVLISFLDRRTAKMRERDDELQRQLDDLKRELEEIKRRV